MSIRDRINKLGSGDQKKAGGRENIVPNLVSIMKYFGWTISDIEKLTIPQYYELLKTIREIEPKEKSEKKGMKHGS